MMNRLSLASIAGMILGPLVAYSLVQLNFTVNNWIDKLMSDWKILRLVLYCARIILSFGSAHSSHSYSYILQWDS